MRHSSPTLRPVLLRGILASTLALILGFSCASPDPGGYGRSALVIGIADYDDVSDLSYTDDDAREMAALLEGQGWDVMLLLDSQATKAGIQAAIQSHFSGLGAGDTALLFYSGHGDAIGGTSYLAPWDTAWNQDSSLKLSSLISPQDISAWFFDGVATDNIIFIMDACNSGGFIPDSESLDAINPAYVAGFSPSTYVSPLRAFADLGELLGRNAQAQGRAAPIVIAAAGSEESSYEDDLHQGIDLKLENGAFTYFLLEAAQRGDGNGDGYVTATEAYTYAARALDRYWNLRGGSSFHPHISGGLRDLVLFGYE